MSSPDEGVESGNTSVSVMNLDSEVESAGSSTNQANTPSSSMQASFVTAVVFRASQLLDLVVKFCEKWVNPALNGIAGGKPTGGGD